MALFIASIITVICSILFFYLDNKTRFSRLNYYLKQIIIGACFGLCACYSATQGSISMDDATLNSRDAAPIVSGLLFGPWAGIISGIIGAACRFFITTPILHLGAYTQVACSVATLFAGFFSALLSVTLFKNHRPLVLHAIIVTIFVETVHISLILLTHLDDLQQATVVMASCFFPLLFCNSITVFFSMFITSIMNQRFEGKSFKEIIAKKDLFFSSNLFYSFQFWLLVIVIVAFTLNAVITNFVYQRAAFENIEEESIVEITELEGIIDNYNNHFGKSSVEDISLILSNWSEPSQASFFLIDEKGNVLSNSVKSNVVADMIVDMEPLQLYNSEIDEEGILVMYDYYDTYKIVEYSYVKYKMFVPCLTICITNFLQIVIFSLLMFGVFLLLKKLIVDQLYTVNDSLVKITEGDLEEKVNVYTNTEFCMLSDSVNSTVDTLKHYIDLEANRYNKELSLAKQIQLSALPCEFPPFPNNPEIDIYATYNAAHEVGGDLYDYYFVDNSKLAFLIADVSGKGIPAAMFMMRCKMAFRMFAEKYKDAALILSYVNNYLCKNNEADIFVTALFGILDIKTGKLQICNAGHNPPVLIRNAKSKYLKFKPNFVLGGIPNIKYVNNYCDLIKNDMLFMYTDGVTEANDKSNNLYGEQRLLDILNAEFKDSKSACRVVVNNLLSFTHNQEQFDDITTFCISYKQ